MEKVPVAKPTTQEVCDKARDAVRKKREEVAKDSVTLDSSLQAMVKRKRPSAAPKANVSPERPPQAEVHSLDSPEQQESLARGQGAETQAADSQVVDPEQAGS